MGRRAVSRRATDAAEVGAGFLLVGGDAGVAGAAEFRAELLRRDDAAGGAGDQSSGEEGVRGVGVVGEDGFAHGAAVGGEAGSEVQRVRGGASSVQAAEEGDLAVEEHSEVHGFA